MSEQNGELTGFVEDGYDHVGFVPGEEKIHPAVKFVYRPALKEEIVRWQMAPGPEARCQIQDAILAAHIRSWSLKRPPGSVEAQRHTGLRLSNKLLDIVAGFADAGTPPEERADLERDAKNF